ncbi:protein TonB [Polaribacter sp. KT25b]|uniref:energy transducer TonB n=1 Tax=Polaribacter sp. KT25b TaxID=1855336 RepID=UPI00087C8575|nr:energy transducer TonB [Polaribacter sp. KT25b]SDS48088.1 protein TonB [Polaribacter sp. KT25b]
MKNLKKLPTKQLEKFSNIFTQLGLVVVLFVVYLTLEHKTEQKQFAVVDFDPPEIVIFNPDEIIEFRREVQKAPKIPEVSVVDVFIPDEPIKKGDNNVVETVINLPKDKIVHINPDDIVVIDETWETPIETVPFINIEFAPVFKGCEGLSKEENKVCFDKKMKKFVQRNFDIELASELGLQSGKYKIQTQFIIDNQGNVVDIQIRAPHDKLKNETQQLIEKLPKFTPGKQRDKSVKVKYTMPISFQVD